MPDTDYENDTDVSFGIFRILFAMWFVVALVLLSSPVWAGDIWLSWEPDLARTDGTTMTADEIKHFTIYYGTEPGTYTKSFNTSDGMVRSIAITDLPPATYYVVVTTVDTGDRESSYSVERSKLVEAPPPPPPPEVAPPKPPALQIQ